MGNEEEMALIGPINTGLSPGWESSSDDTISNNIIDNQNYQYYIRLDYKIDGTNIMMERFGGCRIEYTMDNVY